jgi:hypothetical protein
MEMGKFKQYKMMAPHDTTLPKDLLIFIHTPKLTDIPGILLVKGLNQSINDAKTRW